MDYKKLILPVLFFCAFMVIGSFLYVFIADRTKVQVPKTPDTVKNAVKQDTTETQIASSAAIPAPPVFSAKQVINLTKNGFDPAIIKVKVGILIQWINQSGVEASVNSADHPTHQMYTPLNLGKFPNGSSVSFIFDKPGTYKYHNHLNSSQTGVIVVE